MEVLAKTLVEDVVRLGGALGLGEDERLLDLHFSFVAFRSFRIRKEFADVYKIL
jgi:hypothetical protein